MTRDTQQRQLHDKRYGEKTTTQLETQRENNYIARNPKRKLHSTRHREKTTTQQETQREDNYIAKDTKRRQLHSKRDREKTTTQQEVQREETQSIQLPIYKVSRESRHAHTCSWCLELYHLLPCAQIKDIGFTRCIRCHHMIGITSDEVYARRNTVICNSRTYLCNKNQIYLATIISYYQLM